MTNNEIILEFIQNYHQAIKVTLDQLQYTGNKIDSCGDWIKFFGKISIFLGIVYIITSFAIMFYFQGAAIIMTIIHSIKSIPYFKKHNQIIKRLEVKNKIITDLMYEFQARQRHKR